MAFKRFINLEKRFQREPEVKKLYTDVIEEYKGLGHMQKLDNDDEDGFYLPHHAVFKEASATTKLRVVFDGSAKSSSGVSLNQALFTGPTLQIDLITQLLKFRLYNFVITGDIEKMYRQVLVREEDRKYQRILWRENDGMISTYQLNTVTFGLGPAPFLAIRTILQLVEDEGHNFPLAVKPLTNDLYVDDLLSGADTIEETVKLRDQVIQVLSLGGFNLRQCASNDNSVLNGLSNTRINLNLTQQNDHTLKTLGIYWNSIQDSIQYTVQQLPLNLKVTKRTIASEVAKIFDPLGLVNPSIVQAKLLLQSLWKLQLDWDETLPINLHTQWINFAAQLPLLNDISFHRQPIYKNAKRIEIHGFCDASMIAYGACIYLKSEDDTGNVKVNLYCSKSRLAPLKKPQSIPRYELCAALLLVQLYEMIISSVSLKVNDTFLWTDSTIVLHWIHTPPHMLKPFVASRIAQIQDKINVQNWRHVRTHDNPADLLSRGETPAQLIKNQLWKHGPVWLVQEIHHWPTTSLHFPHDIPEARQATCLKAERIDDSIFYRFSSFKKLHHVVAYCLRFRRGNKHSGPLKIDELQYAHDRLMTLIQRTTLSNEISILHDNKPDTISNKLKNLNPYIDSAGILRVGGRVKNSNISIDCQHPIILPKSHIGTKLIIRQAHEDTLHSGIHATLYYLRQKYWPIDGKNQVRYMVHKCVRCTRCKPPIVQYKMGDLPAVRVNEARPFLNTGVDYCGPFFIKERKFRNKIKLKIYIAIFICLSVKAVHIELVTDLTTDGFIAALRRFTARRGRCANIYSDNGLNFVGANNELTKIIENLKLNCTDDTLRQWLIDNRIVWHFNPPYSPHTGGIWESAVKSLKHHLVRVIGTEIFNYEQLHTLTTEIEAILNSRPLTPLSPDPNDLQALTPSHFLIGDLLTSLPDHNYEHITLNRLSVWQHLQLLKQKFWDRWHKEYLSELNVRSKWSSGTHDITNGTMVILRDDNLPPIHWRLGRVIESIPGNDGIVRTVKIKTKNGITERNVKYISPLPVENPITHTRTDNVNTK